MAAHMSPMDDGLVADEDPDRPGGAARAPL